MIICLQFFPSPSLFPYPNSGYVSQYVHQLHVLLSLCHYVFSLDVVLIFIWHTIRILSVLRLLPYSHTNEICIRWFDFIFWVGNILTCFEKPNYTKKVTHRKVLLSHILSIGSHLKKQCFLVYHFCFFLMMFMIFYFPFFLKLNVTYKLCSFILCFFI